MSDKNNNSANLQNQNTSENKNYLQELKKELSNDVSMAVNNAAAEILKEQDKTEKK